MAYTFDESKEVVAARVKLFRTNFPHYHAPAYKEASARIDFIDPLFIALGWDVHNAQHHSPLYKEVEVEESRDVEGHTKQPDYTFRMGREAVFFVEAKRPGITLKTAAEPAYQIRRYAWSQKLPLSILTDFEEFAVYEGRTRPNVSDKASAARVNFITYEEYADRWREIWDVFSREAVLSGSFQQYADSAKGKRGTGEVDVEFLKDIERWRDVLARNLALRNPGIADAGELNDAVQRTLDRLIFLRIAEDRNIEPYERLRDLTARPEIYTGLTQVYHAADRRYNSGLFDFTKSGDGWMLKLAIDDKVLKDIIGDLYYPHSPYQFDRIPVEILGNVYEQFLGKVIRLTAGHQAKVEEKPEVKKAGGIVYTPAYIVAYIVKQTVGKALEGKSPKQLLGLRVLDMACGSGSFVLGAYQYLLDYYLKWYVEHDPEKHPKAIHRVRGEWRLTIAEKKRILTEHIFGVDIDRQAVEVTKLSLLLKVLEGENDESLQLRLFEDDTVERALPNLDANIKCGNSLIGPDYFADQLLPDADELKRVNPFDWAREFPAAMKAGGFQVIVGNPPYIRIQTMQEWAGLEVEAYKQLYASARSGNYDIYVVFVEKALRLLNTHGQLGFILPHKFFNAQYGAPLREIIAHGQHLAQVVHFGDQQVFAGATTYTCLMFLDKAGSDQCHVVKVDDLAAWRNKGTALEGDIPATTITAAEWNFTVGEGAALFEKLSKMSMKLGDVASIFVGLQTSADKIYILEEIAPSKDGLIKVKDRNNDEWLLEQNVMRRFLNDVTVSTFQRPIAHHWLIFPYQIIDGKAVLIPTKELASSYPNAWEYLKANSKALRDRESGKADTAHWYGYIYRKNLTLFDDPKLIVQVISLYGRYAYDDSGIYFTGGGNGPYYGVRWQIPDNPQSLHYLQVLLSSRLLDWYLHKISSPFRGGYWSYGKRFIEQLPIRPIDFTNPADQAAHDRLVNLVDNMLQLHTRLASANAAHDRELLQRQIAATDRQIDALVYQLYGLTEEEIKIVEGT